MKKIALLFMSVLLVFILIACSSQNSRKKNQTTQPADENVNTGSTQESSEQAGETQTDKTQIEAAGTENGLEGEKFLSRSSEETVKDWIESLEL